MQLYSFIIDYGSYYGLASFYLNTSFSYLGLKQKTWLISLEKVETLRSSKQLKAHKCSSIVIIINHSSYHDFVLFYLNTYVSRFELKQKV